MGISQSKTKIVPIVEKQEQTARICTSDTMIQEELDGIVETRDNTFITQTDFTFSLNEWQPRISHIPAVSTENKIVQTIPPSNHFACQTSDTTGVDSHTQTIKENESNSANEIANLEQEGPHLQKELGVKAGMYTENSIQECFLQNMKLEQKVAELAELNESLKRQQTSQNRYFVLNPAQSIAESPNYYQQKIINLELDLINSKKRLTEACLQYTDKIGKIREKHKARQTESAIKIFELEQEISSNTSSFRIKKNA